MGVRVAFLESPRDTAAGTATAPGVLVPASAVRESEGTDVVFLLRDGRAERRAVSLGGTTGDSRQVKAGVSPGDSVIVDPPPGLSDGDAVSMREGADE
jgi:hypothetical protein